MVLDEVPRAPGAPQDSPRTPRAVLLDEARAGGRLKAAAVMDRARERSGHTYRTLSRVTGVPRTTLQNWLTGMSRPQPTARPGFLRLLDALRLIDPRGTEGGATPMGWWEAIRAADGPREDGSCPFPEASAMSAEPEPPLTGERLEEALLAPARAAGLVIEDAVIEGILHDAGVSAGAVAEPGCTPPSLLLPLINEALRDAWGHRQRDRVLAAMDLRAAGGLGGTVQRRAEAAYASLEASDRERVWPVLAEMIRLDAVVPARASAPLTHPAAARIVEAFCEARILVRSEDRAAISHDLVLRSWPRLLQWLASVRGWPAARRLVARYALTWDEAGRPDALLLGQPAVLHLKEAGREAGLDMDREDETCPALVSSGQDGRIYTRTERDYLQASRSAQAPPQAEPA